MPKPDPEEQEVEATPPPEDPTQFHNPSGHDAGPLSPKEENPVIVSSSTPEAEEEAEPKAAKLSRKEKNAAVQELVDNNTKEALLALASDEGVEAKESQNKEEIAEAIVAARNP